MNEFGFVLDPAIGKPIEQELSGFKVGGLEDGANILSDRNLVNRFGNVILNISGKVRMASIPSDSWKNRFEGVGETNVII
jgi:hypothetical protein